MLKGVEELADAVKVTMGPKVLTFFLFQYVEIWFIEIYIANGLVFNFSVSINWACIISDSVLVIHTY